LEQVVPVPRSPDDVQQNPRLARPVPAIAGIQSHVMGFGKEDELVCGLSALRKCSRLLDAVLGRADGPLVVGVSLLDVNRRKGDGGRGIVAEQAA